MAFFTTTISKYIENNAPRNISLDRKIETARPLLFDFQFPWYSDNEDGKTLFETMFIKEYWEQEIGYETIGLFKMKLCNELTKKMPYWKQLFESQEFIKELSPESPLFNHIFKQTVNETHDNIRTGTSNDTSTDNISKEGNITTSSEATDTIKGTSNSTTVVSSSGESTSTTDGNGSSTEDTQSIHSDNPQTNYSNTDYASEMDRGGVNRSENSHSKTSGTTSSNDNTHTDSSTNNTNTSNSSSTTNSTETSDESTKIDRTHNDTEDLERNLLLNESGFTGDSLSNELMRYRDTIININEMIIEDLSDLFMGVYGTPFFEEGGHIGYGW